MNRIKPFLFMIVFVCAMLSLWAQKTGEVTIKGTITGDLKGYNKMYMYTRMGTDSTLIKDGKYTFHFPFTKVEMKMLLPQYTQSMHQMYQPFGVLISEPGTYYVSSDIVKGFQQSAEVNGVEAAVLYRQFEKKQAIAYLKMNTCLAKLYGNNWYTIDENSPKYRAFKISSDSLEVQYLVPIIENLVREHPNSLASATVLSGAGKRLSSLIEQEKLLRSLSLKMQQTQEGKLFADYIQGRQNAALGKKIIAFSLPDENGTLINLKQFKGKYLLIDFWASWCVPCRQSFPRMREIYKKYKNLNFEILSISIDKNKVAWLKAVKDEANPWPQVLDTKNISQKGFAVNAVPNTFLISPNGVIIAKQVGFDLKGEDNLVEDKIEEVLGGSIKQKTKGSKLEKSNKKPIKATRMTGM